MYLLDTCIILELLLDQERADEVERFLRNVPSEHLHISEFSLYSLGIILLRRKAYDVFQRLVEDLLLSGSTRLVSLRAGEMQLVVQAAKRFNLDFDDAYQYAVAERYDLTIVSFDSDFDRTEQRRQTPEENLTG